MRTRAALAGLAALWLTCRPLSAQQPEGGQMGGQMGGPMGGQDQGGGGGDQSGQQGVPDQGRQPEDSPAPESMSLDDARTNMFTLLQSFLAARQVDGVWPLKSKTERRLLKLKLEDTELRKFRAAGPKHYAGMLGFTDVKTGKPYDADFMVDMTGSNWQVSGMKLSAGTKRKKKKKPASKKAAAAPPLESTDDGALEAPAGDEAAPSGDAP